MATKAEIQKWLDIIVERINDMGPFVCKDWGGSVQFIFPDIKTGWLLKMKMDGTVESLEEKIDEKPATSTVEMNTDLFVKMYEKKISPPEAFNVGMKCEGSMDGLMKVMAPTIE